MKRELPTAFGIVVMLCGITCINKARAAAVFTYVSGPKGCTQPAGYPDAALCIIPNETPLASFPIPAVGNTYVDANFGSTVRILSGFSSNHGYATPTAFSANGKYVALIQNGNQVNVVETATGRVAFTNRPGPSPMTPSDGTRPMTIFTMPFQELKSRNTSYPRTRQRWYGTTRLTGMHSLTYSGEAPATFQKITG